MAAPQSPCVASFSSYIRMGMLRYQLACTLFCSACLALGVRSRARAAGNNGGGGGGKERLLLRAFALLAALLSAAANVLAILTYGYFLETTTVVFSCLSQADQTAMYVTYVAVALACLWPYFHFASNKKIAHVDARQGLSRPLEVTGIRAGSSVGFGY
ncbi:hypothetical protein ACP4OV_017214 [Aristida adscensionis]